MRDSVIEIMDILNLILPLENQITADYFENDEIKNPKEFAEKFIKGRVSYLRDITDTVKKEFVVLSCQKYAPPATALLRVKLSPRQRLVSLPKLITGRGL